MLSLPPVSIATVEAAQAPFVSVAIGVLSASATSAIISAFSSRRGARRTAHHAALDDLRDAAFQLRAAAKAWGDAPKRLPMARRNELDSALVDAARRFEFARAALPHWTVRELAAEWAKLALRYYDGDEAISFDQELAAWQALARRWGQATQSTY